MEKERAAPSRLLELENLLDEQRKDNLDLTERVSKLKVTVSSGKEKDLTYAEQAAQRPILMIPKSK